MSAKFFPRDRWVCRPQISIRRSVSSGARPPRVVDGDLGKQVPSIGQSGAKGSSTPAGPKTLADLPVAAQHAISSAIGRTRRAYRAASGEAGVALANPANGFNAQVQSGALHVSAGSDTWDMSLAGLGYGGAVQPVGTADLKQRQPSRLQLWDNRRVVRQRSERIGAGLQRGSSATVRRHRVIDGRLGLGWRPDGHGKRDGRRTHLDPVRWLGRVGLHGTGCLRRHGENVPASLEVRTEGGPSGPVDSRQRCRGHGQITIDPFVQAAVLTASDGQRRIRHLGFDQRRHGGCRRPDATVGNNAEQGAGLRLH